MSNSNPARLVVPVMTSLINKVKDRVHEHQNKPSEQATEPQATETQAAEPQAGPSNNSENTAKCEQQHEPSGGDASSIANDGLNVHNNARKQKGVNDLQWDDSLAKQAEEYAKHLAKKNAMQHSGTDGQGENLYMSTADASFADATQSWLDEERDYNGEKIGEGDFTKWGHFSKSPRVGSVDGPARFFMYQLAVRCTDGRRSAVCLAQHHPCRHGQGQD